MNNQINGFPTSHVHMLICNALEQVEAPIKGTVIRINGIVVEVHGWTTTNIATETGEKGFWSFSAAYRDCIGDWVITSLHRCGKRRVAANAAIRRRNLNAIKLNGMDAIVLPLFKKRRLSAATRLANARRLADFGSAYSSQFVNQR